MVCNLIIRFEVHSVILNTDSYLFFFPPSNVFTGAKERSEIYEAFENIYPILRGFKKES